MLRTRRRPALFALGLFASACSSDPAPPPADAGPADAPPADAPPTVDVPPVMVRALDDLPPPDRVVAEPGIVRERVMVDVPAPPPNMALGESPVETPAALNRVQVIRYRTDATPAVAVRGVVVAMPGFLGGAGSFDPLARALVRRSVAAGTPVEVWALDRRANLLEDLRGMHAAERLGDPEVATGYYLQETVSFGGQTFPGYLRDRDTSVGYMAEWGLDSTLRDLRAVIARVPAPRSRVVLLGHSLGATIAEAYAAWDFDGTPGYRSLAGVVLVDGGSSGNSVTEMAYRDGGGAGPLGFSVPGLTALRQRGPYFTALPLLGVQALVISEIVARRAALRPTEVVRDSDRDRVFRLLLGVSQVPPMTNAAALGFAFDEASCPLGFARMSLGRPVGPTRSQANPFAPGEMLTVPDSATETYTWQDAPTANPREFTPIVAGAAAWATSPTNFGEWYFPTRITLDASALGDMALPMDAWQVRAGLRAMHARSVDVPVLAVATALVGNAAVYESLRGRLGPSIGTDLPAAGATRADARAFEAVFVPGMTHLDPLTGADDNPANTVPARVLRFVTDNTTGTATVP